MISRSLINVLDNEKWWLVDNNLVSCTYTVSFVQSVTRGKQIFSQF